MMSDSDNNTAVLIVFLILVILVLLLIFLYKRLNHETKNKYTIQQLVYREGGLRDRMMQGVAAVEARLGDRIRRRPHDEEQALSNTEDGETCKVVGKEDVAEDQSEKETKTEEKEEEHHNDSSDDYSSVDLKERVTQNNLKEEEKKEEQKQEEKVANDEAREDESKQEEDVKNKEKVGLIVDLKAFSGSAIWSEEKTESNITAL